MRLPPYHRSRTAALLRGIAAVLALGAAAGCDPPSIEEVCGDLEDQPCSPWSGYYECVEDARAVRARVEQAGGCDGAFDDYLRCLGGVDKCDWSVCNAERVAVIDCIGPL